MKKKIILLISVLIILSIIFFPKGYYDFLKGTNKAAEYLISKNVDSNKRIDKIFDEEDIYAEANERYGIQNMWADVPEKTLYLGVFKGNINNKKEIEKYFEKKLKKFQIYDYKIDVFIME
ncbi:hypothetical protein [Lysinibacillus xylanilyticus]|uniref:hypothetical protein n=1 Tax=Lysinibacillus xylanilyticus TaxID=582475 RepID=UPI003CFF8B3A